MRYCLFLIPVILSCSQPGPIETLGEYDVGPEAGLHFKKYTYVYLPSGDTVVTTFTFVFNQLDTTVTEMSYVNYETTWERRYRLHKNQKELLEEYDFQKPGDYASNYEKVKGDVIEFREIDRGKQFKDLQVEISFTNSIGFKKTVSEEDVFKGDTTLTWNDTRYHALHFGFTVNELVKIKYFPFGGRSNDYGGDAYFARGIGIVRTILRQDGQRFEKNLVSIEKFKDAPLIGY